MQNAYMHYRVDSYRGLTRVVPAHAGDHAKGKPVKPKIIIINFKVMVDSQSGILAYRAIL